MAHFIFSAFSDESGESTVKGQIAACKENGISEMELRGFGKELNINNMTVDQAKEIKKTIDDEGMKVASIGSAYGKINISQYLIAAKCFSQMLDFKDFFTHDHFSSFFLG